MLALQYLQVCWQAVQTDHDVIAVSGIQYLLSSWQSPYTQTHGMQIQPFTARILLLCSSDIVDLSSSTNMWPANGALTGTALYLSTADFAQWHMSAWNADPIVCNSHTRYTCTCSNCSLLCCLTFLKHCISSMGRKAIHSRSCCCSPGHIIRAWQHTVTDYCPGCSQCCSQSLLSSADWTKPSRRESTNSGCLFRR